MQTCKSDIVMLDQAYAKGIYGNARLRNKTTKKKNNRKNQKIMHHPTDT